MAKEAFYFSHDGNARNDIKCMKLRREMSWEGYGLFWALIEMLRSEPDNRLPISAVEDIAFELHVAKEKIVAIILRYDLFKVEDEMFFSERLCRSMEEYNELKTKRVEAGRLGGLSKAKAMLEHTSSYKVKESKVNEMKEKKVFIKPKVADVVKFMVEEKNLDEFTAMGEADKFWNFYESKNWMVGKNKMTVWKSAVANWLTNKNNFNGKPNSNQPGRKPNADDARKRFIEG